MGLLNQSICECRHQEPLTSLRGLAQTRLLQSIGFCVDFLERSPIRVKMHERYFSAIENFAGALVLLASYVHLLIRISNFRNRQIQVPRIFWGTISATITCLPLTNVTARVHLYASDCMVFISMAPYIE